MTEILTGNANDLITVCQIAEKTWWKAYAEILAPEQIRYMLETLYDYESLSKSMEDGSQEFILLKNEAGYQAFASFGRRKESADVFKLHKIYVLPENHGKGYGASLIEEIKRRLLDRNIHILDLNVNRYNRAKSFYEKIGFSVIREEDIPIGPYWMNDYVMRLNF
jgi:diamine N-acetyltransferase